MMRILQVAGIFILFLFLVVSPTMGQIPGPQEPVQPVTPPTMQASTPIPGPQEPVQPVTPPTMQASTPTPTPTPNPTSTIVVGGETATPTPPPTLPVTGQNILWILLVGGAILAGGVFLFFKVRRAG